MTDTVVVTELETGVVEVQVPGPQGPSGLGTAPAGGVLSGNYPDPGFAVDMATQAELNLKADINSPTLTGTPAAPTATAGTSTTQIATTAFVGTAVSNLVNASPAALDTLNELASALGNDANYATTVTNSLALKENSANKNASGGYAGLTLFKLNLHNAANTITSWFTTAATVARTWTLPDKDGTVAMTSDITGTNSGTNTGDQTITLTGGVTGSGTGSFAATVVTNANLTGPITSTGNATAIASQTGTGTKFVVDTSPTLVTPNIGVATGTSLQAIIGNVTPAAGTFTNLTSTGNAALGDAEASDTHAIKGATTLLANSASAALTVTQTGAGNAFVVEDSASTDSTPFVIDASGNAGIKIVTGVFGAPLSISDTGLVSGVSGLNYGVDAYGFGYRSYKTRNASPYVQTIVANADSLGHFTAYGSDGTNFIPAASITAAVDGTPGTNDMPGRLVFSTTADGASSPTEALRIDSKQNVGIGGAAGAGQTLKLAKSITGATAAYGVLQDVSVLSDVTATANGFWSTLSTQAAAFTLPLLTHYNTYQGSIGAGSTVTSQFGFNANATLTGATNNYGFYSNIASAANRYNFYSAGSAPNYFAGNTTIGSALVVGGAVYGANVVAIPAGGVAAYFMSSSNMGVYFGSGAPTVSAAQGSLYLRSDGSTTNDRMYVNTNGSTTWTAVTTAA